MPDRLTKSCGAVVIVTTILAWITAVGCGNVGDPFGAGFEQMHSVHTIYPPDEAVGISVHTLITISFPVQIEIRTLNPTNVLLQRQGGLTVATTIAYDTATRIATVRPLESLSGNTSHQLIVRDVRSSTGEPFRSQTFAFATGTDDPGGAPAIVAVTPIPTQQGMAANTAVQIVFSETMDRASVEAAFNISNGITGSFVWSNVDTTVTFVPGAPLPSGTRLFVTLLNTARDTQGTSLRTGMSWYFETAVVANFVVIDTMPTNGATTVNADTDLRYVFSEPVARSTVVTNFSIDPTMLIAAERFRYELNDQVVIYDPPNVIAGGTVVQATWSTGLMGGSGQTLELPFILTFTIETIPPQVVATDPSNGASQVVADARLAYTFSEAIDRTSVNVASFIVEHPVGAPVAGVITFENNDRTVVFTPTNHFVTGSHPVTVTAAGSIRDLGGTAMGVDVVITFTIDDVAPTVSFTSPTHGALDVVPDAMPTVIIEFNEAVNQPAFDASFTMIPAISGGTFAWPSSRRVHYTATSPLNGDTAYTVSFTMTDLAGNSQSGAFSFTTDDDPPFVIPPVGYTSSGGAMTLDSNLTLNFSERMQRQSLETAFSYTDGVVTFGINAGSVTWYPDNVYPTRMTFDPTANFLPGRNYTVSISNAARDVGGLALTPTFSQTIPTVSP